MTANNEGLEFNILGCQIRIKQDEARDEQAKQAVDIVNQEIESLRKLNPNLKDLDCAVLAALKLASGKIDVEKEYKETTLALKAGINDALDFIEEVSPGTMQARS
ncbi:MAG: cell division protein ZapA [Bacteriovoracaceae bacterium]|nr:cell division protein ZapA [Bacteriovoracaceae bacterium]